MTVCFYEGRCRQIVVPAYDGGTIGILPNHENMVIAVNVGVARMEIEPGDWREVAVGSGFMEIVNNRVTVLVQTAERPEEIDIRHAQEQKERCTGAAASETEYSGILSYAGFSCQGDEPFESITWKALECVNIVDNHKRTVQKDFLCRNCMVLFCC